MSWYDTGSWWESGGNILNFSFCPGCVEAHSVRSCIKWLKDGHPLSIVLCKQDRIICIVSVCEQGLSDADTYLPCACRHDPVNSVNFLTPKHDREHFCLQTIPGRHGATLKIWRHYVNNALFWWVTVFNNRTFHKSRVLKFFLKWPSA